MGAIKGKHLVAASLLAASSLLLINTDAFAWHYYRHGYYHHGGWGYHHGGWRNAGWGYYGAPRVYVNRGWGARCAWQGGYRNLNGHWVRGHRVCW